MHQPASPTDDGVEHDDETSNAPGDDDASTPDEPMPEVMPTDPDVMPPLAPE